jgi:hypothetical protein
MDVSLRGEGGEGGDNGNDAESDNFNNFNFNNANAKAGKLYLLYNLYNWSKQILLYILPNRFEPSFCLGAEIWPVEGLSKDWTFLSFCLSLHESELYKCAVVHERFKLYLIYSSNLSLIWDHYDFCV